MRILLDECVPRPLRRELPGHDVRTIRDMGWAGKKNGELLALMAGDGFEVPLPVDQNFRYQQNLATSGIAVVVMVASTNRLADLMPLIPGVEAALSTIQAGDVVTASAYQTLFSIRTSARKAVLYAQRRSLPRRLSLTG